MIQINGVYCLEGDTHITNDIRRTGTLKWDSTFEKVLQLIGSGNGRTMVDIGAYIGDSTKWFEDAGFKCHAFEPMPDAFECLKLNVSEGTECYHIAVGNGQKYSTTTESDGNLGGRSLILDGRSKSMTLDSQFPNGIDVLKIDAEGFEPFILEGAVNILKSKPIIIIEVNEEALARFGFTSNDILKHLDGYEFEEVYRYGNGQFDVVCFPKMTFAIAMPVCNRPEYTRKALEAIHAMEEWEGLIYASIDCSQDGVVDWRVEDVLSEFGVVKQRAAHKLGCNRNVKAALDLAWESNPDVVICIEDDVIVTPDAFRYIKWAARRYKHDPSYRTIGLWSHKNGWAPDKPWNPSEPTRVMEQSLFSVWGWATWKDRWQEISDDWTTGPDVHDSSWDVVVLAGLNERKEVVPSISRANNIGEIGGTHQGAVHPVVIASGFDTSGPYWTPLPQPEKKKVFVILGAFGDIYMVAKAVPKGSVIACSPEYASIVYELFPELEVYELQGMDRNTLDTAVGICHYKFPTYDIVLAQQDGKGSDVVKPFRNYQQYQISRAKCTAK